MEENTDRFRYETANAICWPTFFASSFLKNRNEPWDSRCKSDENQKQIDKENHGKAWLQKKSSRKEKENESITKSDVTTASSTFFFPA